MISSIQLKKLFIIAFGLFFTAPLFAQEGATNSGDTAWMLTATCLVLIMTLPGLALFYAGLVRSKNILSVLMHCFAIACLASVMWVAFLYSFAFKGSNGFVGDFSAAFLKGVTAESTVGSIPETVFIMFQMTFAIITPALIIGAFVERMKFSAVMLFSALWLVLVYAPAVHWVWSDAGWMLNNGTIDLAGGIVVHATAAISALILAKMVGPRRGFPKNLTPPHSPSLVMIGASMLWFGWFGFNAGSQLSAGGSAGMTMLVTHISAATASLTWMIVERIRTGKPGLVGIVTGMVAGLASITPASGNVGPMGAIIIGLLAGIVCYFACDLVKSKMRIDDSLDVFAVHGIGGIMGTLLVSFLASEALGGSGVSEGKSALQQFGIQILGVGVTLVWSAVATIIIVLICKATVGLRVSPETEEEGLDLAEHGEKDYNL
ncbi:ammonium transporter [Verrucomicrobiales bacterium BCK34]|nr:ammonium transporter [Verrucomicrobiales bacterium BCK34]